MSGLPHERWGAVAVGELVAHDVARPPTAAVLVPGGDGLEATRTSCRTGGSLPAGSAINDDSYLIEADHPLADPNSPTGLIHATPPAPNLTRITVQGSTKKPRECSG